MLLRQGTGLASVVLALLCCPIAASAAAAPKLPEIRTNDGNSVPACASPDRLMAFLKGRNPALDPRFRDIARWYQHWGEAWRVRWDYAFFQMALETNFLTYRRPNGRMGDVDPAQNNFAGIGTTGGGVPGDSYPDVRTGVLAQIQHLVVYSGERLADPVAPRTRLKQDHILSASLRLQRSVRFSDLAKRWAVDPKYGKSIEWVAGQFRAQHCKGRGAFEPQVPGGSEAKLREAPKPVTGIRGVSAEPSQNREAEPSQNRAAAAPPHRKTATTIARQGEKSQGRLALPSGANALSDQPAPEPPRNCAISSASYGGQRTVLIRADLPDATHLTALTVLDGFEDGMTGQFIRSRMPKGQPVGIFHDREAALAEARTICATAYP